MGRHRRAAEDHSGLGRLTEPFLSELWYPVFSADRLRDGETVTADFLGERFLVGRDHGGRLFALAGPPDRQTERPCATAAGLAWLYHGHGEPDGEPPDSAGLGEALPKVAERVVLPCDFDNAVYGLLDPAHDPYVHGSRWWWPRRRLREKRKQIVPSRRGFTMVRHAPTQGALGYRVLGSNVTTEIRFELPGIRTETVKGSRGRVISVTAMTPLARRRIQMLYLLYWDAAWLDPLRPVARRLVRSFIGEDRDVIAKQQEGVHRLTGQMLVGDADAPMRFYLSLKHEWTRAVRDGREFSNPIRDTVLRWRT